MSKLENNKIRNLAELVNIIDRANKSGLLVNGLLYGDLCASVDKFDVRIIYIDNSVNNKVINYSDLIQELFYAVGSNRIKKISIYNNAYCLHLQEAQ